jgi:2-dehydro-3-deoxyglucarate aldolase/4-hydroxy-2-oxoheptanedioate aldolase
MIIEAASRHGKTTAMLVNNAEQARQWKEAGVLLLGYSSEVGVLQQAYRRAMAEIKA